jgi:uncharacterized protein (TIGR02996 family)
MASEDLYWLEQTAANPDDDTLRLVFADWLDERSDSRGPFIRVQTELANLTPDSDGRARLATKAMELFPLAQEAYSRVVPPEIAAYFNDPELSNYKGGVLRRISVGADNLDAFAEHAPVLFRYAPIEQISFEPHTLLPTYSGGYYICATSTECVTKFLQIPQLARLKRLLINGPFEDLEAVVTLVLNCATIAGLHRLEFGERQDERDTNFLPLAMSESSRQGLRAKFGDRALFFGVPV